MKKLFISFLLFVSLSNIVSYTSITIGAGYSTKLDNSNYFYMYNSGYSSGVYFYLKDDSYSLSYYSLEVCYTNTYPSYSSSYPFQNCSPQKTIYYSKKITKSGDSYYFYYFSGDSSKKYYIIYYTGTYSYSGKLYAEASHSSLENKISSSSLSGGIIAVIVIGSLFGLGIIIAVPFIVCCCRRRTTYGGVAFVPPQPTVVITNPTPLAYPMNPQVQVYPANQMYQAPIIV